MRFLRHLHVRPLLVSAFSAIAAFIVVLGTVEFMGLKKAQERGEQMYVNSAQPLAQLGEITEAFQRVRINLRDMVFATAPEREQYFADRVIDLSQRIDSVSAVFETAIKSEEVRVAFEEFQAAGAVYKEAQDRVKAHAFASGEDSLAIAVLNTDAFEAARAGQAKIDRLTELKVEQARRLAAESERAAQISGFVIFGGIIFGLLVALGLGWLISGMIATPLRQLQTAAREVADGNLDVQVEAEAGNEIGELATLFNEMVMQIRASREELEQEKAAIQCKVNEAVAASEAEQVYLSQSVATMVEAMQRFAEGDLNVELAAERDDDIRVLYDGFNEVVVKIHALIHQLMEAVQATMQVASEITLGTNELAAGTQEQSAQAREVAAAVEEMTATIAQSAHHAVQTSDLAVGVGEMAKQGGEVVDKASAKIRDIADVVESSASTVQRLGESSAKIGSIITVINDIADQTNLLALNAAIEAARAGEQGRGFAVVADEVRKLAERTATATTEIAQMIGLIQDETKAAVGAMDRGSEEVKEGLTLADQAGQALMKIVSEMEHLVDQSRQMAAASEEQSTTSHEIASSVETISLVSEESARGITSVSQTADTLTQLTSALDDVIHQFRTDEAVAV